MFILNKIMGGGLNASRAIPGVASGDIKLIDVRDASELRTTGKARGALHMSLSQLQDMADPNHPDFCGSLNSDDQIAVYCASGGRSLAAKRLLKKLGYRDVHNIGSLTQWQAAGGAVESV
jgi:rhodanese-related sulfurtransferase